MASMRKINGKYYGYFYDPTKTPKSKSVPLRVRMKDAAERLLKRLEREYADGTFDPWAPDYGRKTLRSVTYTEAVKLFMDARAHHVKPRTIEDYDQTLNALKLPIGLLLKDLTADHLRPYIYNPHIAQASKRKRYSALRTLLRWCVKEGLLAVNPLEKVEQPRPHDKVPRFLSAADLDRLLIACDYLAETSVRGDYTWLRPAVQLAVATGLRSGELRNLRWSDVDFKQEHVNVVNRDGYVTKTGKERRVPLARPALDVLHALYKSSMRRRADDFVLVDRKGNQIDIYRLSHAFKAAVKAAKLDKRFRFHDSRHTTASWLAMNGVSAVTIQQILGHTTLATTQVYMHLAPETLRAAVTSTFGA